MNRARYKTVNIKCCGKSQKAHQFPRGSGDYRINCQSCGHETWEDTATQPQPNTEGQNDTIRDI